MDGDGDTDLVAGVGIDTILTQNTVSVYLNGGTSFSPGNGRAKGEAVFPRGHRGTIHRFRRPAPTGPQFGFLFAPFSGVPRVLFGRAADPVGADPLEPGVDSGAAILRTPRALHHEFGRGGLMLGATWGFGVSPRRAFGVALGVTAGTRGVPFGLGPIGPAFPAASVPADMASAGYAPDSTLGLFLAISDDGRTVAWRIEDALSPSGTPSNEVLVGRLGSPSAATADAFLVDTIAEVGRVIPSPDGRIPFVAGEPNDPMEGGLDSADVFRADHVCRGQPDFGEPLRKFR